MCYSNSGNVQNPFINWNNCKKHSVCFLSELGLWQLSFKSLLVVHKAAIWKLSYWIFYTVASLSAFQILWQAQNQSNNLSKWEQNMVLSIALIFIKNTAQGCFWIYVHTHIYFYHGSCKNFSCKDLEQLKVIWLRTLLWITRITNNFNCRHCKYICGIRKK